MAEPSARVCPRCGEPAGEVDVCRTCGTSLAAMRGMLPTRADWEAANAERTRAPADQPPPPGSPNSRRNQVLASVAVIALFALIVILGTGSSPHKGHGTTPSHVATAAPTTTAGLPTVAACAAAWDGGRSARHRRDLARAVRGSPRPVAVIGTYVGAQRRVARVGGGNPVLVGADACLLVAGDLVFVRQPDGSWGVTAATRTRFSNVALDPAWTADHANAGVAAAGTVTPARGSLVILTESELGR